MEFLVFAALVWLGIHIGISGTEARGRLVGHFGEQRFVTVYSVASVVSIVLLVAAYRGAPGGGLWLPPHWLQYLGIALMLPAAILFVGSVAGPNPTAMGQQAALAAEPRGIQRITRHPMLCAFAIWAGVHLLMNGTWASLVFFGAFGATAVAGMPSIDHKLAAREPEAWRRLRARTSMIPGAAIVEGRNRLVIGEIPPVVWGGGALLWAAMILLHRPLIGVSVWPS